jgi:hypothetical protein
MGITEWPEGSERTMQISPLVYTLSFTVERPGAHDGMTGVGDPQQTSSRKVLSSA